MSTPFSQKSLIRRLGKISLALEVVLVSSTNGVEDMSTDVYVGVFLELHEEDGSTIVDGGQLPY